MIFQRVGHGAQCGGGTAGCETMGTATRKGSVVYIETMLSKLLCNKYTDAIVHVLACRRVNGAEAL